MSRVKELDIFRNYVNGSENMIVESRGGRSINNSYSEEEAELSFRKKQLEKEKARNKEEAEKFTQSSINQSEPQDLTCKNGKCGEEFCKKCNSVDEVCDDEKDDIKKETIVEDIPTGFRGAFGRTPESFRIIVQEQINEIKTSIATTLSEAKSYIETNLKNEYNTLNEEYSTFQSITKSSPRLQREFNNLDKVMENIQRLFTEQAVGIVVEKHLEYNGLLQEKAMKALQEDLTLWDSIKEEFPMHLHSLKINDYLKLSNIKPATKM